jgi:hypothetical protein
MRGGISQNRVPFSVPNGKRYLEFVGFIVIDSRHGRYR